MVRELQREALAGNLTPSRVSEMLIELTALYGNVIEEVREAEGEYNQVLLQALSGEEAANRATIRAKTSPQYARLREATDFETLTVELIRSLKAVMKQQAEEMRLAR